jgi:uncharacterized protein YjbI with pentapeptide repeats
MTPSKFFGSDSLIRRLFRRVFHWAHPSWASGQSLDEADWLSQHNEISKTIWNLTSVLVGSSLFCLFVLGAPDASLVSSDAKINIPIASISVSYTDFLLFGPIFLIGLTLYLHVFIEQRLRLGRRATTELAPERRPLSPFIFNLGLASADLLSIFLFYGLLPCVLAFFVWKAIPRPDAVWPLCFAFIVLSGLMIALRIRRFEVERHHSLTVPAKAELAVLWILLGGCAVVFFPLAGVTGHIFLGLIHIPPKEPAQQVADSPAFGDFPLLRIRRLQLFGAALDKKNLSGFYGPYADLRKADLRETDLEGANLSHADLRKADLTDANLTASSLRYAHLEGANLKNAKLDGADLRQVTTDEETAIDIKWQRVICIVNGNLNRECLKRNDLTWTDLKGANLEESDLRGMQMTGADLSNADLSKTKLTGAILRIADLRRAQLPPEINQAVTDGALGSSSSGTETIVFLKNRASEACLDAPSVQDNSKRPYMLYPCSEGRDRLESWGVRRRVDGSFVFKSAISVDSACMDGTTFTDGTQVQMWECNDDYENQYWRIAPVTDGYVRIAKNDTGFCIDGTGTRDNSPTPVLRKCDNNDHNQHWLISFGPDKAAERGGLSADLIRRQRERDLNRAISQYAVSPAASIYGSGLPYDQYLQYEYGGRYYGRPFPGSYQPGSGYYGRPFPSSYFPSYYRPGSGSYYRPGPGR